MLPKQAANPQKPGSTALMMSRAVLPIRNAHPAAPSMVFRLFHDLVHPVSADRADLNAQVSDRAGCACCMTEGWGGGRVPIGWTRPPCLYRSLKYPVQIFSLKIPCTRSLQSTSLSTQDVCWSVR